MNVLSLSDYKVVIAERICYDKFENDVILIYNNFTENAVYSIVEMIKNDIGDIEKKGVVFDYKLINIYCTMYLGLAWSMYRKGKHIYNDKKLKKHLVGVLTGNDYKEVIIGITKILSNDKEYSNVLEDITNRYFTLYLGRHIKDIMARMDVTLHPEISHEESLKNIVVNKLRIFALNVLAIGIFEGFYEN